MLREGGFLMKNKGNVVGVTDKKYDGLFIMERSMKKQEETEAERKRKEYEQKHNIK